MKIKKRFAIKNKEKLFLIFFIPNLYSQSAVTYNFSGGRFGDNLISYLHAKWISYKYDIPLLYKPFLYSDHLVLHQIEKKYSDLDLSKFTKVIEFKNNDKLKIEKDSSILYIINYFPESIEEHENPNLPSFITNTSWAERVYFNRPKYFYFKVDWKDKNFLTKVKELIKPINKLNLIYPPKDYHFNVAIHFRKNSNGFDNNLFNFSDTEYDPNKIYTDILFPLKFCCFQYFIDQLKKVSEVYKGKKIYVYIFTDDANPQNIVSQFKKQIDNDLITFDYRNENNNHYTNVLEDFFSLMNFDCLIRTDSNFSNASCKIGNNKIVIFPVTHTWSGTKIFINKVDLEINNF